MPPADNTNTPAPAPAPEPPKKPGFFARLFGKKSQDDAVVPPHASQTPPPALDDTADTSDPVAAPADPSASAPSTDLPASAPVVGPDEAANPVDVPPSVSAAPVESEQGPVSPTLPTQPPAAGASYEATPEEKSKDSSPINPA